jgi:hypothetical protein
MKLILTAALFCPSPEPAPFALIAAPLVWLGLRKR